MYQDYSKLEMNKPPPRQKGTRNVTHVSQWLFSGSLWWFTGPRLPNQKMIITCRFAPRIGETPTFSNDNWLNMCFLLPLLRFIRFHQRLSMDQTDFYNRLPGWWNQSHQDVKERWSYMHSLFLIFQLKFTSSPLKVGEIISKDIHLCLSQYSYTYMYIIYV